MSRCTTNLPWGYMEPQQNNYQAVPQSPEVLFRQQQREQQEQQYANLPAALLGTLKRDKKPFTYTPGGVNLSEVLEARLQKRMERKKKYMEEMEQEKEQEEQHPRRQLVISPTYNTPLNMYSVENALETLEVQAQMAASRSPSSTLPRNFKFKYQEGDEDFEPSQSKAFRVLQVMTDTDSYSGNKKQIKDNTSEMRWTGLREVKSTNPSRFFHTLQKITGTDVEEEEPERQENTRFEKRITRTQTAPIPPAPPMNAAPPPVVPVYAAPVYNSAPQQQPLSFGSAPKLKRPAAFLPKTQPWPAYGRMSTVTPVGTDF